VASSAELAILITGESTGAQKALKHVEGALGGLGGAVGKPAGLIGGLVEGLGKIGLASFGVGAVVESVRGLGEALIGPAMDAEKIAKQTEAVVASTGGVAGMSADAIASLAGDLSKVIPVEDELIQSTENMLLTFTNVGKNIFPQATEAALDMAQALGEDPVAAAMQLGKALNDPINGVTALRRVGVQLSDAQDEQVKKFMAVNDIAGAQGIILQELQKEFGGSARAAGQTFGGQLAILHTQLDNVAESLGGALLPALTDAMKGMNEVLSSDEVQGALTGLAEGLQATFATVGRVVGGVFEVLRGVFLAFTVDAGGMGLALDKVREYFGDAIADGVQPFFQAVMEAIPAIQQFARDVGSHLSALAAVVGQVMRGDIAGAFKAFVGETVAFNVKITEALAGWAQAFIAWIAPMIPPFLDEVGKLAASLLAWAVEQVPIIAAQVAGWIDAFIAWVEPAIRVLLPELANLAERVMSWVSEQAPPLMERLVAEWVPAAIEWVARAAVEILPKLGELLAAVTLWTLTVGVPKLLEGGLALGSAILSGILSGLATLAGDLAAHISAAISQIRIDLGPFHLSAEGFRIDSPPPIQVITENITRSIQQSVTRDPGHNALGTDFWRGGATWVGERGPEIVNLPRGSQVIPNNRLGGAGSGDRGSINVVLQVDGLTLGSVSQAYGSQRVALQAI